MSIENLPALPPGYRYMREIASGAQGTVWLVLNQNMGEPGRSEAIKILSYDTSEDDIGYQRFCKEISTLASLSHPNIVTIYYANPKELYFMMEYLQGGSLYDMMKKGQSLHKTIKLLRQILNGLHFAHSKGLIHRDLKPQNIIFSDHGVPKITDFGLAKELQIDNEEMTMAHTYLGTPYYMAPEQWEDARTVDHRADIWAMGIILYQALAGRVPFPENSLTKLMYSTMAKKPMLPREISPKITEFGKILEPICMKALEKDLDKRYQSAQEMDQDLGKIMSQFSGKSIAPTMQMQQMSRRGNRPGSVRSGAPGRVPGPAKPKNTTMALSFVDEVENKPKPRVQQASQEEFVMLSTKPTPQPVEVSGMQKIRNSIVADKRILAAVCGVGLVLLIFALMMLSPPSASTLRKRLIKGNEQQQLEILQYLEDKKKEKALPALLAALDSEYQPAREKASKMLVQIGEDAVEPLMDILKLEYDDYSVPGKIAVIKTFQGLKNRETASEIRKIAKRSKEEKIRQAARHALIIIDPSYKKDFFMYGDKWLSKIELEKQEYLWINQDWYKAEDFLALYKPFLGQIRNQITHVKKNRHLYISHVTTYHPDAMDLVPWVKSIKDLHDLLQKVNLLKEHIGKNGVETELAMFHNDIAFTGHTLLQELMSIAREIKEKYPIHSLVIHKVVVETYSGFWDDNQWSWVKSSGIAKKFEKRAYQHLEEMLRLQESKKIPIELIADSSIKPILEKEITYALVGAGLYPDYIKRDYQKQNKEYLFLMPKKYWKAWESKTLSVEIKEIFQKRNYELNQQAKWKKNIDNSYFLLSGTNKYLIVSGPKNNLMIFRSKKGKIWVKVYQNNDQCSIEYWNQTDGEKPRLLWKTNFSLKDRENIKGLLSREKIGAKITETTIHLPKILKAQNKATEIFKNQYDTLLLKDGRKWEGLIKRETKTYVEFIYYNRSKNSYKIKKISKRKIATSLKLPEHIRAEKIRQIGKKDTPPQKNIDGQLTISCPKCKAEGKIKCPCDGKGILPCPGPCIKLGVGNWENNPRLGYSRVFHYTDYLGRRSVAAWSKGHIGEVAYIKNGRPVNDGKCKVCKGKSTVPCKRCSGSGEKIPCPKCRGKKILVLDKSKAVVLKDGTLIFGKVLSRSKDIVLIKTEQGELLKLHKDKIKSMPKK